MATPVILHKGAIEPGINNPIVPRFTTNLFLQSQALGTSWSHSAGVVTDNAITAPDGTLTADVWGDNSAGGTGAVVILQNVSGLPDNTDVTFSGYAKSKGLSWIRSDFNAITGSGDASVYFDIDGVATGTADADTVAYGIEPATKTYPSSPAGWVRWWLTGSIVTDLSGNFRIAVADGNNDITVDKDGTSDVYLWGMQLEEVTIGNPPRDYVATTTTSRTRAFNATSTKLWKGAVSPAQVLDTAPVTTGTNVYEMWKGAVNPAELDREGNEYQAAKGAVQPAKEYGVTSDEEQNSGGWAALNWYDSYARKKERRRKEHERLMEELESLPEVEARIAALLHKEMELEAQDNELAELEAMVQSIYTKTQVRQAEQYNARVAKAFIRAAEQRNYSAMQAFERELDRAREEEEFLMMALMILE